MTYFEQTKIYSRAKCNISRHEQPFAIIDSQEQESSEENTRILHEHSNSLTVWNTSCTEEWEEEEEEDEEEEEEDETQEE